MSEEDEKEWVMFKTHHTYFKVLALLYELGKKTGKVNKSDLIEEFQYVAEKRNARQILNHYLREFEKRGMIEINNTNGTITIKELGFGKKVKTTKFVPARMALLCLITSLSTFIISIWTAELTAIILTMTTLITSTIAFLSFFYVTTISDYMFFPRKKKKPQTQQQETTEQK